MREERSISRRQFLCDAAAATAGAAVLGGLAATTRAASPLDIGPGPQLFLDDYFIEQLDGLKRQVQSPQREAEPILDSKRFGTTQPYMTVLRDRASGGYRMWYNHGSAIWHAESSDGVRWANPREVFTCSHCYGASLIDDGDAAGERRFKLANWQATRFKEDKPGDDGGMWVAFSPDGLRWTSYARNAVLPNWPEGHGKYVAYGVQDIIDVFHDPLQKRYAAAVKLPAVASDGYAHAPRAGDSFRRLVGMTTSTDFVHWEKPWRILTPDAKDDGLLEFYGMAAIHQRGALYIGVARVLRDDLPCDSGGPANGIGYSVLVTSRDGVHWQRYREPFLDRNLTPGSWDHAMTWIGYALPMGEEMFFYYGGYARGHKIEPATERQIGLSRMKKDRYVAIVPIREEGVLRTPAFVVPGGQMTINAHARGGGSILVRLLAADGSPIADAMPVDGDALAGELRFPKPLESSRGKPARLDIRLRNAALYAIEFS